MALLKKIIKNDYREVIVKWTGSGTDTLTLASLVATAQTLTGTVLPAVDIVTVSASIAGGADATITRNAEVALQIHDNYEFQTDGIISAVLNENSKFDIVVTLSAPGTMIMRLRKVQGYSEAAL